MAMAATTSLAQRFFCVATMKRPAAAIAESSSARATAEEAMRPAPNVHEEERLTRLWLAFGFSEVNLCFFQWFLLRSLVWLQVSVSVASKFFLFLSRSYLWQHVSGPLWIDGSRKKSCLTDWIRLVFATSVFGWDGSMPWQITEIFQVAIQEMTAQLRRYFNWSLAV